MSFHEEDRNYRKLFAKHMGSDVVDKSVGDGDIDPDLKVDTTRGKIRDEFIADATVTVVLVGRCTWQRKYVDWEIGATLRETDQNPRCGLIGILLPTHPNFNQREFSPHLIPPRLSDNCGGADAFAKIYDWQGRNRGNAGGDIVQGWIHQAFNRRKRQPDPDISRHLFARNWNRACSEGWQD